LPLCCLSTTLLLTPIFFSVIWDRPDRNSPMQRAIR
jgi:hypothetical protein